MLSFYEMKTQITSAYFIFIGWKKVPCEWYILHEFTISNSFSKELERQSKWSYCNLKGH